MNGVSKQDSNTADMIFDCREIIEWLSTDTTLLPGTVILTGTVSDSVPFVVSVWARLPACNLPGSSSASVPILASPVRPFFPTCSLRALSCRHCVGLQPSGVGQARTPPEWLTPGDMVTIKIEQIGELTNPVVAKSAAKL